MYFEKLTLIAALKVNAKHAQDAVVLQQQSQKTLHRVGGTEVAYRSPKISSTKTKSESEATGCLTLL